MVLNTSDIYRRISSWAAGANDRDLLFAAIHARGVLSLAYVMQLSENDPQYMINLAEHQALQREYFIRHPEFEQELAEIQLMEKK